MIGRKFEILGGSAPPKLVRPSRNFFPGDALVKKGRHLLTRKLPGRCSNIATTHQNEVVTLRQMGRYMEQRKKRRSGEQRTSTSGMNWFTSSPASSWVLVVQVVRHPRQVVP